MVVKLVRGEEEWLIKTGTDSEADARKTVEEPIAIDTPAMVDQNGGGWKFDSVVHEHSFPWDADPE